MLGAGPPMDEKLDAILGDVGDMSLAGREDSREERADCAGESVGRIRVARAERKSSVNVCRKYQSARVSTAWPQNFD